MQISVYYKPQPAGTHSELVEDWLLIAELASPHDGGLLSALQDASDDAWLHAGDDQDGDPGLDADAAAANLAACTKRKPRSVNQLMLATQLTNTLTKSGSSLKRSASYESGSLVA